MAETSTVHPVTMPQVNVNDEFVTLVNWLIDDGGEVSEGQALCEVETSKSVGEVPAPWSGFVRHQARPGDLVSIGEVFARIGSSPEELDATCAPAEGVNEKAPDPEVNRSPQATAGAAALAIQYGIELDKVPHTGDRIRREDVEACIHDRTASAPRSFTTDEEKLPEALIELVEAQQPLGDHTWSIGRHLERTQQRVLPAHVMMDVHVDRALEWVAARQRDGLMTSLLPLLIHAAGLAVQKHPVLGSFRLGRDVYRYRAIDVAYTARDTGGLLYTPVVRHVDACGLQHIVAECSRLSMAMFRKQLRPEEMHGACLTVSMLSEHPVRFHVGLQNAWQSVLITSGAVREEVRVVEGRPSAARMLTLAMTYDHGLMDGWQAAEALATLKSVLESLEV